MILYVVIHWKAPYQSSISYSSLYRNQLVEKAPIPPTSQNSANDSLHLEAITSHQILLSRGVAGSHSAPTSPCLEPATPQAVHSILQFLEGSLGDPKDLLGQQEALVARTASESRLIDAKSSLPRKVAATFEQGPTKASMPCDNLCELEAGCQRPADSANPSRDQGTLKLYQQQSDHRSTPPSPTLQRSVSAAEQRSSKQSAWRERPRLAVHRLLSHLFRAQEPVAESTSHIAPRPPTSKRSNPSRLPETLARRNDGLFLHRLQRASTQNVEIVSPPQFIFSSPELTASDQSISPRPPRSQFKSFIRDQLARASDTSSIGYSNSSLDLQQRVRNRRFASTNRGETFDNEILEPFYGYAIHQSVSEVLLGNESYISASEAQAAEKAATSDALCWDDKMLSFLLLCAFIPKVTSSLTLHLDRRSLFALRATCRTWNNALRHYKPPPPSPARTLPSELLRHVYSYLSPQDFNSARHVSHMWMRASLDKILLVSMLSRGGWLSGIFHSISSGATKEEIAALTRSIDIWTLSGYVSRECALGHNWTGNGLWDRESLGKRPAALAEAGRIDFQDLANGFAGKDVSQSSGVVSTVSPCGEFLMAAEGCIIYVYSLGASTVRPLTCVVCPRRVLAVSMDSSSKRFAVAALLYGRMGILCTLNIGRDSSGNVRVYETDIIAGFAGTSLFDTIDVRNGEDDYVLEGTDTPTGRNANWINEEWDLRIESSPRPTLSRRHEAILSQSPMANNSMSTVTGNRTLYRRLCSDDDPPRSVALCPQRRCVAFGCASGIELHWVDAVTGQDLTRWFPLSAPSDYLFFLPPRIGIDTTRKLRLISSTGHPLQRPALARMFRSTPSWLNIWAGLGHDVNQATPIRDELASTLRRDHYHAKPLSDGFHFLFIDPPTGLLCLGTDAPMDSPMKLLRKFCFLPDDIPSLSKHKRSPSHIAKLYAATYNMTTGPRVVAVYGEEVVLYSVPADAFRHSTTEQTIKLAGTAADQSTERLSVTNDEVKPAVPWFEWWPCVTAEQPSENGQADQIQEPMWPLYIRGTSIGKMENGVVDVSVIEKTGAELSIWAFGLDGRAVTWTLDVGNKHVPAIKQTVIAPDGRISERYDVDVEGEGEGEVIIG